MARYLAVRLTLTMLTAVPLWSVPAGAFAGKVPGNHGPVDWPQLGFDAGHSGFNPYEKTISPQNVGSLQQLWSYSIDNWPGDIVENGGILFIPSASGELFAVDASTGHGMWEYNAGIPYGWNTGTNGVAADAGFVFTLCTLPSGGQGLCALGATTGTLQWSYNLSGASGYAGAPPVVSNGVVYFEECSSPGCNYVALNETNGSVLWLVPEPCSGNLMIPPAVYKNALYVGMGCDSQQGTQIVALSTVDGSRIWKRTLPGVQSGLTVADGIVAYMRWTGSESYNGVLKASNGKPMWGPSPVSYHGINGMAAIAYKQLYTWIFIYDYGYMADYAKKAGNQYWKYTIARSFASVANHVVYFAMNGGPLALDADTGGLLWHFGGTDNLGLPIVLNGVVYGGCNGSNVCAYALPGAKKRQHTVRYATTRT